MIPFTDLIASQLLLPSRTPAGVSNPRTLGGQMRRVFDAINDGEWHTLADIEAQTGDKIKSISAQLRNLRKAEGGAYKIIKRERAESVFEYRLIV